MGIKQGLVVVTLCLLQSSSVFLGRLKGLIFPTDPSSTNKKASKYTNMLTHNLYMVALYFKKWYNSSEE